MRVCMCMRAYVCVYECVCVCTGTTQTYEETLGHYEPVPQKPRHHGERPPFPSPLTPGASSSDLVHGQSGQDQGLVFKGIPAGRDRAMTTGDRALRQLVTIHGSLQEAGLGLIRGVETLRRRVRHF